MAKCSKFVINSAKLFYTWTMGKHVDWHHLMMRSSSEKIHTIISSGFGSFLCPFPNLGDTFPDPSLLLRLNSRPASKNLSPVSRERCRVLQLLVKIHQRDPTAKDWKQTNISKYIYYVLYQGSASNSGGEMDQTLKRVNGELRWITAAINYVFFVINIVQNDRVATGSHWQKTAGLRPQDKRPEGGGG